MTTIRTISELAGRDLTAEGWRIQLIYRVFYRVGSGVREVGYYHSEHVADAVIADHPLSPHLVKAVRLALANHEQGFDLGESVLFSFADRKVLPCTLKGANVFVPPLSIPPGDDFVPRHPYHRPDESEGPDPSTHPSWGN